MAPTNPLNGLVLLNSANAALDPARIMLSGSNWSIGLYYKPNTFNINGNLIRLSNDGGFFSLSLSYFGSYQLVVDSPSGSANTGYFADNSRYHSLNLVRDGSALILYESGLSVWSDPTWFVTNPIAALAGETYLTLGGCANFGGARSNFMNFWNVARTSVEILANYDKYYIGTPPGLIANIIGETNTSNNPSLIIYRDNSKSNIAMDNVCPAPSYGFKPGIYQFTPPPVVDGSDSFFFYNYITAGGSPGNLIFTPGALTYYIVPVKSPPDPAGMDASAIDTFAGFTPVPLTNATNPGDGIQFDPVTIPSFNYSVAIYGWVIIQQQGGTPFPPADILISYSPVVDDTPVYNPATLAAGTYSVSLGNLHGYVKAILQVGG